MKIRSGSFSLEKLWYLFAQFFNKGLGLLLIVFISRNLAKNDFGELIFLESIVNVFIVVFAFGSDEVVKRHLYLNKANFQTPKDIFSIVDSTVLVICSVLLSGYVLNFEFFFPAEVYLALMAGAMISYRPFFISINVCKQSLKILSFILIGVAILMAVLTLSFLKDPQFIEIRILLLLLSGCIFRYFVKSPIALFKKPSKETVRFYKQVLPVYVNRIMGLVISHVFPMFLILIVSIASYGEYQYLIRMATVLTVFHATLMQIIEPTIIKNFNKQQAINRPILTIMLKNSLLLLVFGASFYLGIILFHDLLNVNMEVARYNVPYLVGGTLVLFNVENIWRVHKHIGFTKYLAASNVIAFVSSAAVLLIMSKYSSSSNLINHFAVSILVSNLILLLYTLIISKKHGFPSISLADK